MSKRFLRSIPKCPLSSLTLAFFCLYSSLYTHPVLAQAPVAPAARTAPSGTVDVGTTTVAGSVTPVKLADGSQAYQVNGINVADKKAVDVNTFLVANGQRSPIVSELGKRGIEISKVNYVRLTGASPSDDFSKLAGELSEMNKACGVVEVGSVEVWIGTYVHSDGNSEVIALYVADLADGSQQLAAAAVTDQLSAKLGVDPVIVGGDFMSDEKLETVKAAVSLTSAHAASGAGAPGQLRVQAAAACAGTSWAACFKQCLRDQGLAIGFLGILCLLGVAAACAASTVAYAACFAAGLAACGLTAEAGIIVGCAVGCL
jgi:hypothetical protein